MQVWKPSVAAKRGKLVRDSEPIRGESIPSQRVSENVEDEKHTVQPVLLCSLADELMHMKLTLIKEVYCIRRKRLQQCSIPSSLLFLTTHLHK